MRKIIEKYADLFMAKVQKTDGCWLWSGGKAVRNTKFTPVVYGRYAIRLSRKSLTGFYAHRFSYELHKGPIPHGLQVDHLCKNTLCVNPAHLEAVSARTNVLRGNTVSAAHAKKTRCPQGHPYLGDNLTFKRRHGRVMRECRICKAARISAWRKRKKASQLSTPKSTK